MGQARHMTITVLHTPHSLYPKEGNALNYLRKSYSPLRPRLWGATHHAPPSLQPGRVTVSLPCVPIGPKRYANTYKKSYYV